MSTEHYYGSNTGHKTVHTMVQQPFHQKTGPFAMARLFLVLLLGFLFLASEVLSGPSSPSESLVRRGSQRELMVLYGGLGLGSGGVRM